MASTSASTISKAKVFTRLGLLESQIHKALRRLTNITEDILTTIDKGLDKHYISKVIIFGTNDQNVCRAMLVLEIDWGEYNFQLSQGKATITIDSRWHDDTAIELDEAIKLFDKFATENKL